MIRINLLPFRAARKKENIRRQVFIFVSFMILTTLAMLYYNMVLADQVQAWTEKVDKTRKDLIAAERKAKEVDKIKAEIETLEKKMAVIQELEVNRREPIEFMENIARATVPKRMWLTSLSSDDMAIGIKGIALDNKTIADFMTRLEGLKIYTSVNLTSVKHDVKNEINIKKFELTCTKVFVAPEEEEAKKKKK